MLDERLDSSSPADAPVQERDLQRLQARGDLYRYLVENSLGLICAHDTSGMLLAINAEAARLLEYPAEELVGRNIRELVDPEVQRMFAHYLHRINTRGKASGELRLVKRSGATMTWFYRNSLYEQAGSEPMVIGHALDITRHLHMEDKLKESTEQYRALFEQAPVAYHEINREGVIVRVNRAECKLLGWSREELLGRAVWELISSGQKADSERQVKLKLSGKQELKPFHREYVRKDGEKRTLLIHDDLILSTAGQIVGIRSTLLDVTDQHRAEAELRQINADLDARIAERTAELEKSNGRLNEFVHMVSHDLREPLRSIASFSALLRQRSGAKLDEESREFLDHVISSSARMAALIQDLLQFSRTAKGQMAMAEVNLNEAVDAALENLSEAIQSSGAEIECGQLPTVRASFTQMTQLFQNLVDNGVKYRGPRAPTITIRGEQAGVGVTIWVSDNGIGIPTEERARVFSPFQRLSDGASSGSGIGLTICQAIVERHGGRIWIEDAPGGGTTFRFTIAAAAGL